MEATAIGTVTEVAVTWLQTKGNSAFHPSKVNRSSVGVSGLGYRLDMFPYLR